MSKHWVTIRGLRVVTTCWSWAWSNRTSPSKWVGLGSPLAANSVYGDLTCSVHTVNNLCMFNCQCHFYLCNRGPYVRLTFVPNMLSFCNKDIIIIITVELHNYTVSLQNFKRFKRSFAGSDRGREVTFSSCCPHTQLVATTRYIFALDIYNLKRYTLYHNIILKKKKHILFRQQTRKPAPTYNTRAQTPNKSNI